MNPTLTERVACFSYTLLAFSLTHIPMDSVYVPVDSESEDSDDTSVGYSPMQNAIVLNSSAMNYDNYENSVDDISIFSVNRFLMDQTTHNSEPCSSDDDCTVVGDDLEPSIQPSKSPRIEYVQTGDDRKIAYKIAVMKERRRREGMCILENLRACQESRKRKCVDDEYEWADSRKKFKNSFVASDSASEDEIKTWRVIKTPQWHRRAIRALR
ncbi:hypothetical protein BC829DRAFT_440832 [Chytridium lagenaria]|nr:hypothetical protein BC829DRAFT_440832 [Chytridium lagenaria]